MSYLVTARKWRPQNFNEVVGQEHVTRTLKNAIRQNRIGQSYLFSGPRGVGKTTLARVLVKALNCVTGPTDEPCNKCRFCEEINSNRSLDYIEIDGASNRGIDQIRDINEHIKYASPDGKYRIFVIDEVHMLTIEAFNALLKSLEEPPPRIVFIFCTTESHKVPLTIRSRCQHYSFRSFSIAQISDHLEKILIAEKIEFEKSAIFPIAKAANGSMRDSQSILDQVIAYSGGKISLTSVLEVLGINNSELYFTFLSNLAAGKLNENKELLYKMIRQGKEIRLFFFETLSYLSAINYIHAKITDLNILEISESDYQELLKLSQSFSIPNLHTLSDICFDFIRELKQNTEESVILNYFIVKIHRYKELISPGQLKSDMLQLSKALRDAEIVNPTPTEGKATPSARPSAIEKNSPVSATATPAPSAPLTRAPEQSFPTKLATPSSPQIAMNDGGNPNSSLQGGKPTTLATNTSNASSNATIAKAVEMFEAKIVDP